MEEKIVGILKENAEGLSITDIVEISGLSRLTVRTVLARLEGGEKVFIRKVGMAKLYYLKKAQK